MFIDAQNIPTVTSQHTSSKPRRAYAFACNSCKRRKIKCNGDRPLCAGCEKYGEECHYGVRKPIHRPSIDSASHGTPQYISHARGSNSNSPVLGLDHLANAATHISNQASTSMRTLSNSKPNRNPNQESGSCCPQPGNPCQPRSQSNDLNFRRETEEDIQVQRGRLRENAGRVKLWEMIGFRSLDPAGPEVSVVFDALEDWWAWQWTLFPCIYKPTFLQSIPPSSTLHSSFLLHVLYSRLSSPFPSSSLNTSNPPPNSPAQIDWSKRLRPLLFESIESGSKYSTIQGLLVHSQSECAAGNSGGAWVWAGMAYRMILDLGIHLDYLGSAGYRGLTPEEKESRRLIWWNAYTWDTMLSLVMAREPTWQPHMGNEIMLPLDDTGDETVWLPYYSPSTGFRDTGTYAPQKSYSNLTYAWFCRLCKIINLTLRKRYQSGSASEISMDDVAQIARALDEWWIALPREIRLDPVYLPESSPPPHIVSLNIMYQAAIVLLYRPGCCSNAPTGQKRFSDICVVASSAVHELLLLHGRSFAYKNLPYIVNYCICLVASVSAVETSSMDSRQASLARSRLELALHVLEVNRPSNPGIMRCIQVLRNCLPEPAAPYDGPYENANGFSAVLGESDFANMDIPDEEFWKWLSMNVVATDFA